MLSPSHLHSRQSLARSGALGLISRLSAFVFIGATLLNAGAYLAQAQQSDISAPPTTQQAPPPSTTPPPESTKPAKQAQAQDSPKQTPSNGTTATKDSPQTSATGPTQQDPPASPRQVSPPIPQKPAEDPPPQASPPDSQKNSGTGATPTEGQGPSWQGIPASPKQTAPGGEAPASQSPPAGATPPAGQGSPWQTPPAGPNQTAPAGQTAPSQAPPTGPAAPNEHVSPAPRPPAHGGPGVGFRLENADLLQFINLVASELKLNYVVDPGVRGVVNISTEGEFKTQDLLPILQTVLKMNNATAIKTGNFYRIVPLSAAPKNPLGISPTGAPLAADDRMLMQIIPLKFVFAADMAKMLQPFLSEGGTVSVHEGANSLILVDDSLNVKRLVEILDQFDNSSFVDQRVRLIPVRNNVASALIPELEAIFSTYALSGKETPMRFVPLDRINGILAAAADPAAFDEVTKWVEKLDQPAAPNGIQTFIYKVQNSEAAHLVNLLKSLRGEGGESAAETMPGTTGHGRGTRGGGSTEVTLNTGQGLQARGSETTSGLGAYNAQGGQESGEAPETHLHIATDPVSNSVIVQSTAAEYADIAKTLEMLDVLPRQVMIEARVYEVDLSGDLEFGLEYYLQNKTQPNTFLGSFTSANALQLQAGINYGMTRQIMSYLNASENRTRVRTLSAPTVLAIDSSDARIQVGESVPVLTSQGISQGGSTLGTSLFTSTVQNVDTGIILSVTPRISTTGLVSLTISQEISSEEPPPAGVSIASPSFLKRSVTTHAVAQDGQTIALGGLISYTRNKTTNRIPLLGDIPWLGIIFGSTSFNTSETELIVLLTPHIISTRPGAIEATRELVDKLHDLKREFKKDKLLNP